MDYTTLVHRVRELVWEHVPSGSVVAVVSKGDPALILFDQRTGVHYPQAPSGNYLGHHPSTGATAVAHLESLRQRGAEYLVIPATYSWFLDFYTDLRSHLNREGELVHGDENCTIYSLTKREHLTAPTNTAAERQLRELVSAVLPYGSTVIAFNWAHGALVGAGEFQLLEAPSAEMGGESGFPAFATGIQHTGAEYLVVPAPSAGYRPSGDPLLERCRAVWATVLEQRHVCAVFAIPGPAVVR